MQEPNTDITSATELFSDYYEGTLAADKRAELEARMRDEPAVATAYREFEMTMKAISGMHKMSAPMAFDKKVEETIHRRSGGRFFGRRALGDRIPYEVLAIFILLVAALVFWLERTSSTGGHKPEPKAPKIDKRVEEVIPTR